MTLRSEINLISKSTWREQGLPWDLNIIFIIWPVSAQKSSLTAVRTFSFHWLLVLHGCLFINPFFDSCPKKFPSSFPVLWRGFLIDFFFHSNVVKEEKHLSLIIFLFLFVKDEHRRIAFFSNQVFSASPLTDERTEACKGIRCTFRNSETQTDFNGDLQVWSLWCST